MNWEVCEPLLGASQGEKSSTHATDVDEGENTISNMLQFCHLNDPEQETNLVSRPVSDGSVLSTEIHVRQQEY